MKSVLAICAILALCSLADATGPCVVRQRVAVVPHHAQAYVAPYVAPAAVYAPVHVVPIYSHGYGSTNEELAGKIERLEFELEKQKFQQEKRDFQQKQQLPAPQRMPPAKERSQLKPADKEHPAVAILAKNCLSCHNATKREGKLDLTAALTDKQLRKIATMTYMEEMPPGKPLTDADVGTIQQWVAAHQ
jgi:hypothetical protein